MDIGGSGMREVNLLITSGGRKGQLLHYFKYELGGVGKLIVADCDTTAPVLYLADNSYIIPSATDPSYIPTLKEICIKEEINAIISLLDSELSVLSKHKQEFKKMGIKIFISDYETIEVCLDKYATYCFIKRNGFNIVPTYIDLEKFKKDYYLKKIQFPIILKPRYGSASLEVNKAANLQEVETIFEMNADILIQQYIQGQEYGVDVYVDEISKEVVSIFIKKKLKMTAGQIDKAVSIKNEKLQNYIIDFVKKLNIIGQADIDVFEMGGEFYILEVNPRFGAGYLIAYQCGQNSPQYIMNNVCGHKNKPEIVQYEENMYMMRYDVVVIKHASQLIS